MRYGRSQRPPFASVLRALLDAYQPVSSHLIEMAQHRLWPHAHFSGNHRSKFAAIGENAQDHLAPICFRGIAAGMAPVGWLDYAYRMRDECRGIVFNVLCEWVHHLIISWVDVCKIAPGTARPDLIASRMATLSTLGGGASG